MTKDCQTILDFLGCEYELFENEPDGAKICARHEELWGEGKGFTPLLIIVSDVLAETIELNCEDAEVELNPIGEEALRNDIIGYVRVIV
jgi:hypothetical protein